MDKPPYKHTGDIIYGSDFNILCDYLNAKIGVNIEKVNPGSIVYGNSFISMYNSIMASNPNSILPPITNFYSGKLITANDYNMIDDAIEKAIQEINIILSGNNINPNINSLVKAYFPSWDGNIKVKVNITILQGAIVGSSSTSVPSFYAGNLPAGSEIVIVNYGYILGKGGKGGYPGGGAGGWGGPLVGNPGGTAIHADMKLTINNMGIIGGGGGGGGGGTGGQQNGYWNASGGPGSGGAGFNVGEAGDINWSGTSNGRVGRGNNGSILTGGNAGGIYWGYEENGGSGGDLGQPGHASGWNRTAGGAAGKAVEGNSNIIWINTGDIRGAIT